MKSARSRAQRGFSLVEVVIALGVASFCLLTLMGLLVVGINGSSMSAQQSVAVNIATAVATDLRATPLNGQNYTPTLKLFSPRFGIAVPAPTTASGMQSFFVSVDGTPLTQVYPTTITATPPAGTAYRVTLQGPLRPSVTGQRVASPVFILVTWPGDADPNESVWPSHFTGSFQTSIYLDLN
jgi:prepilin-type N-terminal cleavage/methylation domain-containing protein